MQGSCGFAQSAGRASLQKALRVEIAKQMDELPNEPRPAGLMAGPQPGAVVAVEVFMEKDIVAPLRIVLELLHAAVHRPPARRIAQKDAGQAMRQLLADFEEIK